MSDESRSDELRVLWKSQSEETPPAARDQIVNRRARELYFRTRAEILASIAAAIFFAVVMAWRLGRSQDSLLAWGFAAIIVWVVISLYRFRNRIWRGHSAQLDALAIPSLEFYRKELERRCHHLGNEWTWHGPLVLACLMLVAILSNRTFRGFGRIETVLPLGAILGVWTIYGIRQRRRLVNQLQQEIGEIDRLRD